MWSRLDHVIFHVRIVSLCHTLLVMVLLTQIHTRMHHPMMLDRPRGGQQMWFQQSLRRRRRSPRGVLPGRVSAFQESRSDDSKAVGKRSGPVSASEKIDGYVRRSVETSIRTRNYRVTVGDVAAEAGVSLLDAQRALSALALDSKATLMVSNDGEIMYEFPRNFQDVVRGASLKIRLEPALKTAGQVMSYLGRVTFGAALIASVATVTLALSVLSSSSRNDDSRGSGRVMYRRPLFVDLMDMWWYFDPYYYRRRRAMLRQGGTDEMGFLESIFSCVFGDGDPNEEFEVQRWNALGRYIQSRGGVVTAEELAPFLDATMKEFNAVTTDDGIVVQESFVLQALTKFDGEPTVDDAGNIVYAFPSLQSSARQRPMAVPYDAVLEKEWMLTRALTGQKIMVGLLGAVNFVAVVALSVSVQNPRNVYVLTVNGLQGIIGLMPYLQAYALSFAIIPLVRWFTMKQKNAGIQDRNAARMTAAKALMSPSQALQTKLRAKEGKAVFKTVSTNNMVYSSDEDISSYVTRREGESMDDWEQRFAQRYRD